MTPRYKADSNSDVVDCDLTMATTYPIASVEKEPRRRYFSEGTLVRAIDGDTFVVHLDLGHHQARWNGRIRLQGFDAPESRRVGQVEKLHHLLATEHATFLLEQDTFKVETLHELDGDVKTNFSRWESHIWVRVYRHGNVDLMPLAKVMKLEGYSKLPPRIYADMEKLAVEGGDSFEKQLGRWILDCRNKANVFYRSLPSFDGDVVAIDAALDEAIAAVQFPELPS